MPIRFRCAYCNQLMGIARRKAGTIVKCPTCSGQVVVPQLEEETSNGAEVSHSPVASEKSSPAPNPLEREDFDKVFQQSAQQSGSAAAVQAPVPSPPSQQYDVEIVPVPQEQQQGQGIYITSKKATIFAVIVILLLALAFGGGVMVGRFLL